jgi:hypothetical protein
MMNRTSIHRFFSTKVNASKAAPTEQIHRKAITAITKLSHVRLDLPKVTSDNILPLVR